MADGTLVKFRHLPWEEVRARAALTGDSAAVIAVSAGALDAMHALENASFVTEAVKLMAHALPKRESVWWACMCARHTEPPDLTEADVAALVGAESWVRAQTDEARRKAFEHAEQANFATAEAWAAVSAFWSGDSMSPLGQPKTPPAPHLAGTAVIGSITLAAVRAFPARRDARLRRFLAAGREIAGGGAGRLPAEEAS